MMMMMVTMMTKMIQCLTEASLMKEINKILFYIILHCFINISTSLHHSQNQMLSLCKMGPYSELFWSVFSCIRTEYGESECWKIRTRITPNTDTFHLVYGYRCLATGLWCDISRGTFFLILNFFKWTFELSLANRV